MLKIIDIVAIAFVVGAFSDVACADNLKGKFISADEISALTRAIDAAKKSHFDIKHIDANVVTKSDRISIILHEVPFEDGNALKMPPFGSAACRIYDVFKDGRIVRNVCFEK